MTRLEEFLVELDVALAELQNAIGFLEKEESRFAPGSPQQQAVAFLLAHYAQLLPRRDMCIAYLRTLNEMPGAEPGAKGRLLQWKNGARLKVEHKGRLLQWKNEAGLKVERNEPHFAPVA